MLAMKSKKLEQIEEDDRKIELMETYRNFLKSDLWEEWEKIETDQRRRVPAPPTQKPYPEDATLFDLVAPQDFTVGKMPLIEAIRHRRSHRKYTEEALTLEELSFLLWATQGISKVMTKKLRKKLIDTVGSSKEVVDTIDSSTLRTVPSGGARHPFETYLLVNRVIGLEHGLYRYLPLEHKLCFLYVNTELTEKVHDACYKQYVKNSAVTFIWAAIPYRTEWRYSIVSPKIIAQDSGHLCQNLYLASEAIGAGTCAVGAYDQGKMDLILGVDGKEEFAIYVAPVGKIKSGTSLRKSQSTRNANR